MASQPKAAARPHSPILVTLPGATSIELYEAGFRTVAGFQNLQLVRQWRAFPDEPNRYLRHLSSPGASSPPDDE